MKMLLLRKNNLINTGLFIVSVVLLIWPAIENGYPLLFSDSITYMVSGQINHVPIERPITYGLFVRHLSLSYSMWFVVVIQSIIVNYVLFLFIKYYVGSEKSFLIHFIFAFFLFFFTGIDYYTSFIVPDIFTSVSILSLFLLFSLKREQYVHLTFLSIVFVLSVIFHLSHLPLTLAALFSIGILAFLFHAFPLRDILFRSSFILMLFFLSISTLMLINFSMGAGLKISRNNNIVLAARLIESGLVNDYLKKNCSKKNFTPSYIELCEYVDEFHRWPAAGFYLWVEDSPLYANGCAEKGWENCWVEKDVAYGKLLKDVIKEPGYIQEIIAISITGTLKQLITFEQVKLDPVNIEGILSDFYKDDIYSYKNSNQSKSKITFEEENLLEAIIFDISVLIAFILLFFYWSKMDSQSKLLLFIMLFTLLINAFLCATLSNVVPRYQGRIAFLLPYVIILILLKIYKKSNRNKKFDLSKII